MSGVASAARSMVARWAACRTSSRAPGMRARIARMAAEGGASALLVDFAGPHPLVIEGEVLRELAQGHRLVEVAGGGFGWAVAQDPSPGTSLATPAE